MNRLTALAAALWMSLPAAPVLAGPVVVELFTSQGCSSCPPADAILHKLAKRDDVLPLALHVDYWDYIGWKDQYADPAHTKRQKGYAAAAGRNMIYTPQMIVMGQDSIVGADAMAVLETVEKHRAIEPPVRISLQRSGEDLTISLQPVPGRAQGPYQVHLVRFAPLKQAEITRGELAGRRLDYANVVEEWHQLGEWNAKDDYSLTLPLKGSQPAAVLVQQPGHGAIVAAARAG